MCIIHYYRKGVNLLLSVSYSVNNKTIKSSDLGKIQITKKEYIDYMDSLKNEVTKIYCNENVTKMNNAG